VNLVPLGGALMTMLVGLFTEELVARNRAVGWLFDSMNGLLSGRGPGPVLLARMKKLAKIAKS
jgi:hypothetical protein